MKRLVFALFSLLVLSLGTQVQAQAKPINLDTVHSRIGFTASTLLFDVDGHFNDYKVLVDGDPNKPTSAKVELIIEAGSIDTDNAKRDSHLKNEDFLDVEKYPKITFKSRRIAQQGNKLTVTGTLTLHGKSKTIKIPFKIAKGKNGAGVDSVAYKGKLTLNRKEFGIGTDSIAAKISLEDEVEIDLLLVVLP